MPHQPAAKFRIVCATQFGKDRFLSDTPLGRSLYAMRGMRNLEVSLYEKNQHCFAHVYNDAITRSVARPATLVFIRDDVQICDYYWSGSIASGLAHFDIIGVAGSICRQPRQAGWRYRDDTALPVDARDLSGIANLGVGFPDVKFELLRAPGVSVRLLDGCLISASSATLIARGLRFDEGFRNHFYAADFCRSAEMRGLKMGTWWLSVVCSRDDEAGSAEWKEEYAAYIRKWSD